MNSRQTTNTVYNDQNDKNEHKLYESESYDTNMESFIDK